MRDVVSVMAVQAPTTEYERAQQREASKILSKRLEENCQGFDLRDRDCFKLYLEIKERLRRIDNLVEQASNCTKKLENIQRSLLNLFHFFAVEVKQLYDICERAHALIPDTERPLKKDYMVQFFEATKVCLSTSYI